MDEEYWQRLTGIKILSGSHKGRAPITLTSFVPEPFTAKFWDAFLQGSDHDKRDS